MLKILGWYYAIIGIVTRFAPRFYTPGDDLRDWTSEMFGPYNAGIDGTERARGYLQVISSKLDVIKPIMNNLTAHLLALGKRPTHHQPPLSRRIDNTKRTFAPRRRSFWGSWLQVYRLCF